MTSTHIEAEAPNGESMRQGKTHPHLAGDLANPRTTNDPAARLA
jgi:hypothetical protein